MKKEKGITLIALVVTIIVLIILAGISIQLILGENGIIAKAKYAKKETKYSQDMDMIKMAMGVDDIEWELDSYPEEEEEFGIFLKELRKTDKEAEIKDILWPELIVYYNKDYYAIDYLTREIRKMEKQVNDGEYLYYNGMIALRGSAEAGLDGKEFTYGSEKIEIPSTYLGKKVEAIGMKESLAERLLNRQYAKVYENIKRPKAMKLYEVASMEAYCGINAIDVKEIVLPDGIIAINPNAFGNCDSLQKINIPNSVKSIGKYAFFYCTTLESIEISSSVEYMEDDVFMGCDNLKTIKVPFREGKEPSGWDVNWKRGCDAEVIYAE